LAEPPVVLELATVPCIECDTEHGPDSPDLRVELTDDDQLIVYCAECSQRELGEA
jgi:hypothetical protein